MLKKENICEHLQNVIVIVVSKLNLANFLSKFQDLMKIWMFISCCMIGWVCLPKTKKRVHKRWEE